MNKNHLSYLIVPVMAMFAVGCTVSDTPPPPPSGPSEFSLSLAISANPDVLSQDGGSQSVVTIDARDSNGQPAPNTVLRLEIEGGDFGTLSTRSVVTNSSGRATFTYTAPRGSPGGSSDEGVRILVTPSGTDASSAVSRQVHIRLIPTGTINTGAPNPLFTFLPQNPTAFQTVRFDGTGSTASRGAVIAQYVWEFGDGSGGTGATATHAYSVPGTYGVRLTVTDSNGVSATSAPQVVTVGDGTPPTAMFVSSPAEPRAGRSVFFNAGQSTAGPGRSITSYRWNFGDGDTGSGVTRSHTYDEEGTFVVVLTVTDDAGQKATASASVTVCPVAGCAEEEPEEE